MNNRYLYCEDFKNIRKENHNLLQLQYVSLLREIELLNLYDVLLKDLTFLIYNNASFKLYIINC
jgi:hypothetical protein